MAEARGNRNTNLCFIGVDEEKRVQEVLQGAQGKLSCVNLADGDSMKE